ncbi:hypothetical protein R1sor_010989 [Riccia sorocarpa]|uniref:Uncharacterized protein n=1 Tax=Riccia sorocarpa TaxID=122646 RepID=A0ABD3HZL6_9MARC
MTHESNPGKMKPGSSHSMLSPRLPADGKEEEEARQDKMEPGAKLADLCDEDKAKVARLINQVLLQPDKVAQSCTPTAETEKSKAGFPMTVLEADRSNLHPSNMKEKACDQQPTVTEAVSEPGMGVERQSELSGNLEQTDVQLNSGLRGKENQCIEQTESQSFAEQQKTPTQRRRPLPRPLPDLVVNILHMQKEVMSNGDSTALPDRPTEVNTAVQVQEPGSPNAERESGLERNSTGNAENQRSEGIRHKYSGESDESLVSSKSKKKLRFDPTAGEEGAFYYASDPGSSTCGRDVNDQNSKLQHQKLSVELTCSKCTQLVNKRNAGRNWDHQGGDTPEDSSVFANRPKMSVARRGGPGIREMDNLDIIHVTNHEDHGPDTISRSRIIRFKDNHCSAIKEAAAASELYSRHVHLCVKCSSPLMSKVPRHHRRYKMKEWNETDMTPNYETDDTSSTSRISESSLPGRSQPKLITRSIRSSSYLPSTRTWQMTVSEEEDIEGNNFHRRTSSGKQKVVKCKKHVHKDFHRQGLAPTGHTRIKDGRADDKKFEQADFVYDTSDSRLLQQSATAIRSIASRRSPPVQPMRFHLKDRRHDSRQEATGMDDEGDQFSEPRSDEFQVNHEKFETSSLSETENSESLKCSSLVEEAVVVLSEDQAGFRQGKCYRSSAEGRLELGSKAASCRQKVVGLKPEFQKRDKTLIKLPKISREVSKHNTTGKELVEGNERAEGGDTLSEKRRTSVVDLLGRFIRSNEECAAELIKCFKSKVVAPEDSEPRRGTSHGESSPECKAHKSQEAKMRERESETSTMNLPTRKMTSEQPKRCSGCLAVLKNKVSGSEEKTDVELNDSEIRCGSCSTSDAVLQNPGLQSSRSKGAGDNPTPDPTSSTDKQDEGNCKQGRMEMTGPVLTVGEDRKTSSAADIDNEEEFDTTENWHLGTFDISLLHLVNDLEVEETESWNQIHTQTPYGNSSSRKYDKGRKPWVLGHGQAYTVGRLFPAKRSTGIKQFR